MNHTKYLYSKDKTKHRKLYFIIVAIFAGQLFHTQAKESEFIFTCQPYLQQVSGTEATIMWATNKNAVSWVEIAPNDTLHFYATEHPNFLTRILVEKKSENCTKSVSLDLHLPPHIVTAFFPKKLLIKNIRI